MSDLIEKWHEQSMSAYAERNWLTHSIRSVWA